MNPDGHKNPDSDRDLETHMAPDSFQQAWQTQSSRTRVTIDTDLLLKEVQRNQRDFRARIFRRDFVEVGIALLLIPYWLYAGITKSLPWTWYLTVPALLWMAGFMLVYRMRHQQRSEQPDEPLLPCVKRSLTEMQDQIWLLRNIFWWYLLPPSISILAFWTHSAWLNFEDWWDVLFYGYLVVFLVALYSFIYWLNQRAVDSDLEPRRQELLTLLASLGDEPAGRLLPTSRSDRVTSPIKLGRWPIVAAAACLALLVMISLSGGLFDSRYNQPARSSGPSGESLAKLITDQRQDKKLVGLAAMVMVNGQVEAAAAHGERKKGSGVPLETGDRWHLGGVTKSITATMIGRLVESNRMSWSDTLDECFPDASIHEDWKPVTLLQLLTDTAGAPANFSIERRFEQPPLGPECTRARRAAVLEVIANGPQSTPGQRHVYSNVGYTIAAAMAEQATGASWSDLVIQEIFEPLKLSDAGFGPPVSPAKTLPQPRGHRRWLGKKTAASDQADNTPIMGPSGSVHMTLGDLCTYAAEHLRGNLGEGQLLSAETYELLHTSALGDYACGWMLKEPSYEIPHPVYWHNGSNTMWYALVVFIPNKKMVVAVTSNDGDFEQAESAAWEIVNATAKQFNVETDAERRRALPSEAFPMISPFAAVRWNNDQPEVQLGGEWFKLVSIDEIPASEIVDYSRKAYGSKWQKRFEEDLVQLLTRMGHSPQSNVKLVVQSLSSSETSVREGVPMTRANRRAIRNAARDRISAEPPAKTD